MEWKYIKYLFCFLLLLLGFYYIAHAQIASVRLTSSAVFQPSPVLPTTGAVVRVIDGDTLVLETDEHVRLLGMNAPEKGERYHDEAQQRLASLVEGKTVTLEADKINKDKYGRLLRYVFVNDTLVNAVLVEEGYAVPFILTSAPRYKTQITSAQQHCLEQKIRLCAHHNP